MKDRAMNAAPDAHGAVMETARRALSRIADAIPSSQPVAYVDYPVHDNVGDLLINQGTDAFLEDHHYVVACRLSLHDLAVTDRSGRPLVELKPAVAELDAVVAGGATLVLHGGGNMGDLWPHHQVFRELLVERYPDAKIVALPQSVHFGADEARDRAAALFGRHRDLTIFVRDRESLGFIQDHCGLDGEMLPDMAHQLWGRPAFAAPVGGGTLFQRRRDKEAREDVTRIEDAFDWDDLRSSTDTLVLRALRKWQSVGNPLRHTVPNHRSWYAFRDRLIRRAVERFVPYATIDTDRLHGMILGALLGKRVRFGEGSYGKLGRYHAAWLAASDRLEAAPSLSEAA